MIGVNLSGSSPISITYDAFNRIVEENNSGVYKQVLYSPVGKLAMMAKQVATTVFLPLPGGEQATYSGSTIRFHQAGLPKSLVLYNARHTFGTAVYEATGNLAVVMKSMGHTDVRTSMRYQHPGLEPIREAIEERNLRHN